MKGRVYQETSLSQAVTVLLINIAMVIGPTPPGTGQRQQYLELGRSHGAILRFQPYVCFER